MKIKLTFFTFFCLLVAFSLNSCEGDQGPAGAVGSIGPVGPSGPEGPEGAGFQDCASCHQTQKIAAKVFQWEHSTHATGGQFTRNNASCAGCHTSQGFLDRISAGGMTATMDVEDPLPQNCYTCHQIHSTFTEQDWALTQQEPVTFWVGGETHDLGKANLCISCHQARVSTPALPDPATGGTITITNKRYGPHHGAQGMMFTGSGAYKVGDGYANGFHINVIENACVTCHMATVDGVEAGGHTFNVANEDGEINQAGCVQCHEISDELDVMIEATQTDIATLLEDLQNLLLDRGILNPDDLPYANASNSNPLELTEHEAGVLYNYQYVREDQSLGIHNYRFAKTLLENSIEALD